MHVTEPDESQRYAALYDATVQQAVGSAGALMARLVAQTRATLRAGETAAATTLEEDRLTLSRRLLNQCEAQLCERFTEELLTAFSRVAVSEQRAGPVSATESLHFDQLAGMDAAQLHAAVETARVQHVVQRASDGALIELNGLVCRMLGLESVQLERNPLRPAVYVEALTRALAYLPVPAAARQQWMTMMSGMLGRELDVYYRALSTQLKERGVDGSMFDTKKTTPPDTLEAAPAHDTQLTLEKLRRLLGERRVPDDGAVAGLSFDTPDSGLMGPQSGFGDHAEPVPTAFRPTVPAALGAVEEMKQLDRMVERIEARRAAPLPPAHTLEHARAQMFSAAHGLEQSLGLEVVTLMVDNITHDQRLLSPVQAVVAELEPALLQLALSDPRFFSHKQHPARRLLHEITQRSIAFESVESRGFSGFMEPLREAVAPLSGGTADSAEAFDRVLGQLVALWDTPSAGKDKRQLAKAVKALQKAEQRNALAATTAMDVLARKDAGHVPDAVLDFLCGPWAQVVAHARMSDRAGTEDPGHYAALIDELLWSAQPQLTARDVPALTRLVPRLLTRLRAGLATIDFPPLKTSEFFEVLMQLHQRGFQKKSVGKEHAPLPSGGSHSAAARLAAADAAAPWVAPHEAKASGFLEIAPDDDGRPTLPPPPAGMEGLQVGTWVELQAESQWLRTQLTWVSANQTLLLFADASGTMQSLTRRSCSQWLATGKMRLFATDPVEDALDGVARTAAKNSLDLEF